MAHPTQKPSLSTMSRAEQPFRLLDLPAELWVRIGKMTIDATPCFTEKHLQPTSDLSPAERTARKQPAITHTCRVLRHELLAYYYCTKVTINVVQDHYFVPGLIYELVPTRDIRDRLNRWLLAIGPRNRNIIRRFEINSYVFGGGPWTLFFNDSFSWEIESKTVSLSRGGNFTYRIRFLGSGEEK